MSDVMQTQDESSIVIELYFDLEKASERFNGDKVDNEIPGFIHITGQKEDPRIQTLAEAPAQEENATGAKGPFVFPYSSSIFMGVGGQPAEQPGAEAQATSKPPIQTQRQRNLDHGHQTQSVGAMVPESYRGYSPRIPRYEAMLPSPFVYYPQEQLNSHHYPQIRQFKAISPRLPVFFRTHHQNSPSQPQVPMAQYVRKGLFPYTPVVTCPEDETAEDYEVEEVMDSIETEGQVKYLVKWEGWPAKRHWTWEPYEHFYGDGAKAAVEDFHRQHLGKPVDPKVNAPDVTSSP
ncbi:hypothetical protein F4678DRAFT_465408 [Xylaria arbuscula]|nr:hypothetical protein F4678DRAFT_465408 [Xylaria arbuscula]